MMTTKPKMMFNGMINPPCARMDGESLDDYFVRLFEYKSQYSLTCREIADLLNMENGVRYEESTWRKEYAAFSRGREYERGRAKDGVHTRILSISDLHYPFHLPVSTFESYFGRVDTLVLNGDLLDMREISRFTKSYRQSPMDEITGCRDYVIDLIRRIAPKSVYVTYGNHCLRFEKYIAKNVECDLGELLPKTPLDLIFTDGFYRYDKERHTKIWHESIREVFPDIHVEYTGNWWVQIGRTVFAHPKAFKSSPLATVAKAAEYFVRKNRDMDACVLAHTHHMGVYPQDGIVLYEQGAACRVEDMQYSDGNLAHSAERGAIYLCQDAKGALIFDATKLIRL